MKREIIFRGKTKWKTQEFVYGNLTIKNGEHEIGFYADTNNRGVNYINVSVIEETVGQYIGLTDKNGAKIFEGNIIEQTNFNGSQYIAKYAVCYDGDGFCLRMIQGNEKAMAGSGYSAFSYTDEKELKKGYIIGNIHDNPELLTK